MSSNRHHHNFIVNALTGYVHKKKFVGTADEKEFYRVMPINGPDKIFFSSEEEYRIWAARTYGNQKDGRTSFVVGG